MLSPLLFNFLVNSLAAATRCASPSVLLLPLSDFRFTFQVYADDLVILAEFECDLQLSLTAATFWGQQRRLSFGMGPDKSAAMVFGPARSKPSCSVFLSGQLLLLFVSSYRCFGVLISSLYPFHLSGSPALRAKYFVAHSQGLFVSFTLFLLNTNILPSATFSAEFIGDCTRSLAQLEHNDDGDVISLDGHRARCPHQYFMKLRFPTVSECLLVELWLCSADSTRSLQDRVATVFTLSMHTSGMWAHWCLSLLHHAAETLDSLVLVGDL